MNADMLFEGSDPLPLFLLETFFDKVKRRLPKLIVSDNTLDTDKCLNYLNQSIDTIQAQLKYTQANKFESLFKQSISEVSQKIDSFITGEKKLHEMTPAWHELIDIKVNFKSMLTDLVNAENTPTISSSPSNLLISEKSQSLQIFNLRNGDEIWEYRAKHLLDKMLSDFNLRSVQISQGSSWKQVFKWASSTYKAIEKAQAHIGLEKSHAGVEKCLNLGFNPESLKQSRGNGKMFADEDCNTILLTSFPKEVQITIWQHEYAHVLDNRVGIKLAQSQLSKEQMHSCIFLSQVEMERQLSDSSYKTSDNEMLSDAQIWMSEAISDAVCGSSSESLKEHNQKCSKEFSRSLAENFIIQCIGEYNWLNLYDNTKQNLLNNKNILKFVDNMTEDIYKNGVNKFYTTVVKEEKNSKNLNEAIYSISNTVNNNYVTRDSFLNFEKNIEYMSWDFLKIMKKYYYSHTNGQRYFSKSKTAIAASERSLNFISPYHTRTLEIFARSCEDLQRPLILSTPEYFMEKEKSLINTENFLNPILNKNERKVFIQTIHSLVKALGMKVVNNMESLPALKEFVINSAQTTYSSMSENEYNANLVLEKATTRTFKMAV